MVVKAAEEIVSRASIHSRAELHKALYRNCKIRVREATGVAAEARKHEITREETNEKSSQSRKEQFANIKTRLPLVMGMNPLRTTPYGSVQI